MKESTMVIAAHADDEALGCGGTMARLAEEGAQIVVVFMADGVFSRKKSSRVDKKEKKCRGCSPEDLGIEKKSSPRPARQPDGSGSDAPDRAES